MFPIYKYELQVSRNSDKETDRMREMNEERRERERDGERQW